MSNNLLLVPSEKDTSIIMVPVQAVTQDLVTKTDYLIYVPLASKNTFGTVKIGDGIDVSNGVISISEHGSVIDSKVDKFQGVEKYKQALIVDENGFVTTGYAPGSIDIYKNATLVKEDAGYLRYSDDFTVDDEMGGGVFLSLKHPVPLKTSDLTNDGDGHSPYVTQDFVNLYGGKIDELYVNNDLQSIINKKVYLKIPTKLSDLGIDKDIAYLDDVSRAVSEHNIDNNAHYSIQTKLLEVEAIAKGRGQAISYMSYMYMVNAFNSLPINEYPVGQTVYINTVNVPDLWISSVDETSEVYAYTSDTAIVNALKNDGKIKIGYYVLSPLETEKVDLTNYLTLDTIQTVSGIKTFTEMIGLLNSAEGEADFIKHINNNFLITSHDGKSLLNIDEQLEKIYSFNKELVNKNYVLDNYLSFTENQTLTSEQQELIRNKIGVGGGSGGTDDFNDLSNLPVLKTDNSATLVAGEETVQNTINLHKISKTGLLSDLTEDTTHRTVSDSEKTNWNKAYTTLLSIEGDVELIDNKLRLLSDSYNDLYGKIPTVYNSTITIKQGDETKGSFTLNQNGDATIELDAGESGSDVNLYSGLGQNTDGAMTQKATTDELNKKVEFEDFDEIEFTPSMQTQLNNMQSQLNNMQGQLSSTQNEVNNKADKSQWVNVEKFITGQSNMTVDLSSILPDDTTNYEILFHTYSWGSTGTWVGSVVKVNTPALTNDISIAGGRTYANSTEAMVIGSTIIPVLGSNRSITIKPEYIGNGGYRILGYRRISK